MNKISIYFLLVVSLVGCTYNSKITNIEKGTAMLDSLEEEIITDRDMLKTLQPKVSTQAVMKKSEPPKKKRIPSQQIRAEIEEEVEPLMIVDTLGQKPHFPGGDSEMYRCIIQNMKYPVIAQESGIQGQVILEFIIKADGSITDVHVKRGIDPSCDREAVRVVKNMPKWSPASQNGKPEGVSYMMPIIFELKD